jgi:hypothetical protein
LYHGADSGPRLVNGRMVIIRRTCLCSQAELPVGVASGAWRAFNPRVCLATCHSPLGRIAFRESCATQR